MIEHVERFCAEFDFALFAKWKVLGQAEIQLAETRAAHTILGRRAEGKRGRGCEGGCIGPARRCPGLTGGCGLKGIADLVRPVLVLLRVGIVYRKNWRERLARARLENAVQLPAAQYRFRQ